MKRTLLSFMLLVATVVAMADTKLISGSVEPLIGERNVPIAVRFDNAVYEKCGTVEDFLAKAPRRSDWNKASLSYMLYALNDKTGEYGTTFVGEDKASSKYYVVLEVNSIKKNGAIKGQILIKQLTNQKPLATFSFSSDDEDDDDEVAFRDQYQSIGKSFGKLLKSEFKSAKKNKK